MMTKTQKVLSVLSTLTIGAVGGHHLDDIIEKYNLEVGRYPMQIEYLITDSCLSVDEKPIPYIQYERKLEDCTCALEESEFQYDYTNYKLDENEFLKIFKKSFKECRTVRK